MCFLSNVHILLWDCRWNDATWYFEVFRVWVCCIGFLVRFAVWQAVLSALKASISAFDLQWCGRCFSLLLWLASFSLSFMLLLSLRRQKSWWCIYDAMIKLAKRKALLPVQERGRAEKSASVQYWKSKAKRKWKLK